MIRSGFFAVLGVVVAGAAVAQVAPPVGQTAAPPDSWVPRAGVALIGLDKITARTTPLATRIGQTVKFGSLSVTVRSCIVRGPDQPADEAAFVDVTDSRDAAFGFHGWMLLSSPGASVVEHPVYDVRLVGCRA